ncbi:proteasome accessory factor PafA2 family protein, partial [Frankia sp. CpI1-P]
MSARRIMGIETEYGVSVPGQPNTNQMLASSLVVNSYANRTSSSGSRARWDFEEESPLRDARGFE